MANWDLTDPFAEQRRTDGALVGNFGGEDIAMVLGYKDVRAAAADYKQFSSDTPFRVPIPSEEDVRSVRQLPIELDPPEHKAYRAIVQPFFSRPRQPEMIAQIEQLVATMIDHAVTCDGIDVINEFALPLQSRALTYLLGMPMSEADLWISWGTHVFHGDELLDSNKGNAVDEYLQAQFDRAERNPGDDFFSALCKADIHGKPLSRDEKVGFANLAFAGGRDTVINTICFALAHLAGCPEDRLRIRENPTLVRGAAEEVVRVVSPLTMIGRTCPHATRINGVDVRAGQRAALCWASANRDETVFEDPLEVQIDRKRNAHVGFGAGNHLCLGASHARLLLRTVMGQVSDKVSDMQVTELMPEYEEWPAYRRQTGYKTLRMTLSA